MTLENDQGFMLYCHYGEPLKELTDAEAGQLIKALFKYEDTGEIADLSGKVKLAFLFIRTWMDIDAKGGEV